MAPVPTAHRDLYDTLSDEQLHHRGRALASVDDVLMDEDAMGMQSQPSLAKDSQDMDQILSDLGTSEIAQADLLQAIKSFDSAGEGLSSGEQESIFPLSGFDLSEIDNSEGDSVEDKVRLNQARIERRTLFYLRRVRIYQARCIGKRVAEEVAQTFEKATKGARKDGGGRPLGLKALVKKVETTAALQASAASRSVTGPRYYRAGTSKGDASKSASLGIPSGTFNDLDDKAGALGFHLSVVKNSLDSDATASSSGAESDDEAVPYNNPHQQQMPIEKRALWTWQKRRARIAASASWIQAQVQELEYKIRQYHDLQISVRAAKGPVQFEGEPSKSDGASVSGYDGGLPGASETAPLAEGETCARARPLRRDTFSKRRLLQMRGLHLATDRAARPADISCSCQWPAECCAVCTGRADATRPAPPHAALPPAQRIALADPGYHPALCDVRDIPPSVHMDALSSRSWFRARFAKAWRGAHHNAAGTTHAQSQATPPAAAAHRRADTKQPRRLKRGRPPLSRKVKERDRDEDTSTSSHERPRGRASTETRGWRRQSYDIDNIVIPQSVAANTRPEILTYKEIVTPKWRVMELPETPMNNGIVKSNRISVESEDEEDISEPAVHARHVRAESRERGRYVRKTRVRRAATERVDTMNAIDETNARDHRPTNAKGAVNTTNSSDVIINTSDAVDVCDAVNVCDAISVCDAINVSDAINATDSLDSSECPRHAPLELVLPAPRLVGDDRETVRPYSPRHFPLPEEVYQDMLAKMPDGYRPSSPEPSPVMIDEEEASSTLSPLSPPVEFEGDDPDDTEWEPSNEKMERRRSGLR